MPEQSDAEVTVASDRASIGWFTEDDINDVLGDLPGGQGVSEATRRLHRCLISARQQLRAARESQA